MSTAEAVDRTVVSKGDYARLRGRSPQALSGWIKEGKLRAPALVGDGRAARIWVEEADRQLGSLLDVAQQVGQAKVPVGAPASDDAARLARARAETAELTLQRERARLEAERGIYMPTAAARAVWAAELAGLKREIELWLGQEAAAEVAAETGASAQAVKAALKRSFRAFSERVADRADAAASELPEHANRDMANAA